VNTLKSTRVRRHRSFRRLKANAHEEPVRGTPDGQSSIDSVDVRVGRLLEVRAGGPRGSLADVRALFQKIRRLLRAHPEERFVVVSDWRHCPLLAAEASELVLRSITTNNPRIVRSAALLSADSLVDTFRFLGLLRDGEDERHRLFRETAALTGWLAEVLRPKELDRLHAFLSDRTSP
jgi:hypothetical protein